MTPEAYERHKERTRNRRREQTSAGQEIGAIPPPSDELLRAQCEQSLQRFCEICYPETFSKPWSDVHLRIIAKLERTVLEGASLAVAIPRGWGKSSLLKATVAWAKAIGRSRYSVLVAASKDLSERLMADLKELLQGERFCSLFPELGHAIRSLEGEARRARGQRHHGRRTGIAWGTRQVVLARIPGARAGGAIITAVSLMGGMRGLSKVVGTGETLRPDLVLLDDPQTDASAASMVMTERRVSMLRKVIRGLAEGGRRLSILIACTVIEGGDFSDQAVNPEIFPQLSGERHKAVKRWPDDPGERWLEYAELWAKEQAEEQTFAAATAFYAANREEMDAGSVCTWEHDFDPQTELSPLQHNWNLRLEMKEGYWSEYANEVHRPELADVATLEKRHLEDTRITSIARGVIPQEAERVTVGVDIQKNFLVWLVAAWRPSLGGHVVAYGTWPGQPKASWTRRDAERTMQAELPGQAWETQLRHALDGLAEHLLGRAWAREDGTAVQLDRMLVDCGWGASTDTVYRWAAESRYAARITPAKGIGIGPSEPPMPEKKPQPGVRTGADWRYSVPRGRSLPTLNIDANRWKTAVAEGHRAPLGSPTAIGWHAGAPSLHGTLVRHLMAERPTMESSEGTGIRMQVWGKPSGDNDLLDAAMMAMAGASLSGLAFGAAEAAAKQTPVRKRRRPSRRARMTV